MKIKKKSTKVNTKKKSKISAKKSSKKSKTKKHLIKVMVAHDNKTEDHTTKAHKFAENLDKIGVDAIEAGFAAASEGELEAIKIIANAGLHAKVFSMARGVKAAIDAVLKTGAKGVHLVIPSSDWHLKVKLKKNRHKRIMLLTHSMGSIVAFDLLNKTNNSFNVHTLITMGSPLGQPTILSKMVDDNPIINHPKVPDNIKRWVNFADLKDFVAFDPTLNDDFAANNLGVTPVDFEIYNKS